MNMEENRNNRNDSNQYNFITDGMQQERTSSAPAKPVKKKKNGLRKRIITAVVAAFITAGAIVAASLAVNILMSRANTVPAGTNADVQNENGDTKKENSHAVVDTAVTDGYQKEMRGVWIASVGNLNYPSAKGLSENQLKKEIDTILADCADVGFNTIFFQVRPSADALYKSEIFPWAECLSGTQGKAPENEFDSLSYILEKAPEYGIEIHAWVNPFRVTAGSAANPKHDVNLLSEKHPARLNPSYVIPYADGKLYFDPGNPEVRDLIVSGIKELCENYPTLGGIHLDDYFYPYPVAGAEDFADDESFSKYGNGLDRADFRRNSVNLFVKQAYDTVKGTNSEMRFGISPFGIWANNTSDTPVEGSISSGLEAYSSLYCDALAWVNGGYVDYICPQDYWSFTTSAAPFDNIARWWNAQLDGTGVDLYIGHAAYKAPSYAKNEIPVQIEFVRSLMSYRGSVFYGYADIKKNSAGVRDGIKKAFESNREIKTVSNADYSLSVNYPANGSTTSESTSYILGTSNPLYPLTVNGKKVSRTKDGCFSLYETLKDGSNTYKFVCGKETVTYTLKKGKAKSQGGSSPKNMSKYEITSATPDKPLWLIPGDIVAVTCTAPAGSKVYASFGAYTVEMLPTVYPATSSHSYPETYKGSIKVNDIIASDGEIADIGKLTVYASKNGKKAEKVLTEVKQMGKGAKIYAEVKNDYSYLKRSTVSSFYGDPIPANAGMRDYITAFVNGYYRLGCGYYISENDVNVVEGKSLPEIRILSAKVSADIKDSSNNLENFTNLEFKVTDNIPVNVIKENGKLKVILFNAASEGLPNVKISANPMVSSASAYVENGNAVYEFTLKNAENYYGFNTVYADGSVIIRLNNPQSVKEGEKPLTGKTIVVDAGHGGTDSGAQGPTKYGSGFNEKDLNLGIALELRKKLEELGAKVVMIREEDKTVVLQERIDFLSDIIPDLMISVHHNSVVNTVNAAKARGYVGLYSDDAGILLANAVSDTVTTELSRYQRVTSYQALAVARNHRFPSTLCEMSFISYTEEFRWTTAEGGYERSAEALADGVLEFYERQKKYLKY